MLYTIVPQHLDRELCQKTLATLPPEKTRRVLTGEIVEVIEWHGRPNRGQTVELLCGAVRVHSAETEYWEDKGCPCRETRTAVTMLPGTIIMVQGYGTQGWVGGTVWCPAGVVYYVYE